MVPPIQYTEMAKFLIENVEKIDHRNLNEGVPISLAFRFMKEADLEFSRLKGRHIAT